MNMWQISAKKHELIERATCPDYKTTERDVAEAVELVNQYIDELERIELTPTLRGQEQDIDAVTEIIMKVWYP